MTRAPHSISRTFRLGPVAQERAASPQADVGIALLSGFGSANADRGNEEKKSPEEALREEIASST